MVAISAILLANQNLGICGDLSTLLNASTPILKALGDQQQQEDNAEAARLITSLY